ncbi:glutathione S-transferase family protein [Lichenifustis flavocetrariae]|uniref:Glutathione S-transferase N-terminal domain-containing protein n=1 Tax=Lichenifustis flavocetrariae TaxID=2949735 RepID=A0AA41YU09_9HYPH|nr:glutathione S-transferase N-terminal domain-containing protein [Lichenifustis flavocetrariae]MCW6507211.1 glutathione S-transferase N-terminal domain-containing protein [Lichenifustis flavocetrariae]
MISPKLFYSPGACSLAPHIALEETGEPFEPVLVDTKTGVHREPPYLRINPKARVPALAIGDWVLTENPALLQFIARSYPDAGLWPEDLRAQAKAMEWLAWIASTVHVAYAHVRRAERYATSEAALADVRAKGLDASRDLWRAIERQVGAGPWVLGERYTVVDAYLFVFWLWGQGPALQLPMAEFCPAWTAQARAMGKRPAVQRALAREQIAFPT